MGRVMRLELFGDLCRVCFEDSSGRRLLPLATSVLQDLERSMDTLLQIPLSMKHVCASLLGSTAKTKPLQSGSTCPSKIRFLGWRIPLRVIS
jgi:hypothetical protein